jgi:hypothetical protein
MCTHSQCHYDHCRESKRVLSFPLYVQLFFFQAFLSEGTLAWRYRDSTSSLIRRSGLYLPAASVILNARESLTGWVSAGVQLTDFNNIVLCWSADGQHLAVYSNEEFYEKTLLPVTLKITVAWG